MSTTVRAALKSACYSLVEVDSVVPRLILSLERFLNTMSGLSE